MAETCRSVIHEDYPDTPIEIEVLKEPDQVAFGNGTGIM